MDRRIAHLARRQHGLVTRRQLLAAGLHPDRVDEAVRSGRLERVARGVYCVPGAPQTPAREVMAAVLRCGPDALAVGERMLAMLRVVGAELDGPFHVLARPGRRVRNVPWRVRSRAEDWPGVRATIAGVPSVTLPWNLAAAAVWASPEDLERLADGVRWHGRGYVDGVRQLIHDHAGWHEGARRLRRSGLFEADAGHSPPERILRRALAHHRPSAQVELLPRVMVDLFIRSARLVIEYDGYATHTGPGAVRRDEHRRAALRAAGYVVVTVTAEDLQDLPALVARIDALVDVLAA